jgi:sortase A
MPFRALRPTGFALQALGLVGMVVVGVAYADGAIESRAAIAAFEQAASQAAPAEFGAEALVPDQSLWSETARSRYAATEKAGSVPIALLKIERLNLVAPVFPGTDAITLNRGVGLVKGTALPGETGNVALSGHRDSFFRPLKDIAIADSIELRTRRGVQHFRVAEIHIVDPLDVSVLDPSDAPILTLITCYPFYYVGYAPDRYVVRATLVEAGSAEDRPLPRAALGGKAQNGL